MKPFYRKKRYGIILILLLLCYFCFVPSPMRISPETTLVTDSLKPDGMPDYFADWSNKTWLPNISPAEDNGMRLMIAACGPSVLEQAAIVRDVPWQEMPTNEKSKQWFNEYWLPMCESMGIDPYAEPKYLKTRDVDSWLYEKAEEETEEEKTKSTNEIYKDYEKKYKLTPWKAADEPELAQRLQEYSPVLDLVGIAVRKPHFDAWRKYPGALEAVLLPDIQASRNYVRNLQVRVAFRLGEGDLDGAWYDVMSMFFLARHFLYSDIVVVKLVGNACENAACESAQTILQTRQSRQEQLVRFADELRNLPNRWDEAVVSSDFDYHLMYEILLRLYKGSVKERLTLAKDFKEMANKEFSPVCQILPLDMNIAGNRLSELRHLDNFREWQSNPVLWCRNAAKKVKELSIQQGKASSWVSYPLIRTRSRLIAEDIHCLYKSTWDSFLTAAVNVGTKMELLRLAVSLEIYKQDNEKYPERLEDLVPKYVSELPLDPFTGRYTLQYKAEGSGYRLYSWGSNGKDDGGTHDIYEGDLVLTLE